MTFQTRTKRFSPWHALWHVPLLLALLVAGLWYGALAPSAWLNNWRALGQPDSGPAHQWLRETIATGRFATAKLMLSSSRIDPDSELVLALFHLAADGGDAEAQNKLGYMYSAGMAVPRNEDKALDYFRKAAARGHAAAQNALGFRYSTGRGVTRDDAEAVKWFQLAAEGGNANGQFNLARAYANGQGIPKDPEEAFRWMFRAAVQGHDDAQVALGYLYEKGLGVKADPIAAYLWYALAARQGSASGKEYLDALKTRLSDSQIASAERRVSRWKN